MPVDAEVVVSAVAAVIALAALGLTIQQTRLTREHNKLSVRPVLDLGETFRPGQRLGPAQIISGTVWLDGVERSEPFGKPVIDALRDVLSERQSRPSASTFTAGTVLAKDYDAFLLSVDLYDPDIDGEFVELLGRLRIRISYASLYGDEDVVEWWRGR